MGVGGENPKEFEACGIPHRERGARVSEAIDVVRALWRDTPATFKRPFTQFEGVSIDPKPVQKGGPPIWVGGRSRRGPGPPATGRRLGLLRGHPGTLPSEPGQDSRDRGRLQLGLDGFAAAHLTFITVAVTTSRRGRPGSRGSASATPRILGRSRARYGVIGTPAQCAERLEAFPRAAGCSYFLMNPICEPPEEREQLETIAAEILPRSKGLRMLQLRPN